MSERFGVDIKTLPGWDAVDEVRLVNNAIKHAGRVSDELAKGYPKQWAAGQPLGDLAGTYARLRPNITIYLTALARRFA